MAVKKTFCKCTDKFNISLIRLISNSPYIRILKIRTRRKLVLMKLSSAVALVANLLARGASDVSVLQKIASRAREVKIVTRAREVKF